MNELLAVILLLAVAMALLGVRLLCGKRRFIHTHIDGNPHMASRGIHCAKQQDREAQAGRRRIEEHTKKNDDKTLYLFIMTNTKQLIALAALGLAMAACSGNGEDKKAAARPAGDSASVSEGITVAYVNTDSIMTRYTFCVDYTEVLKKKAQAMDNTLSSKGVALQKKIAEFQSKLENGNFTTREQAEAAQASIQKEQTQLQNLQQSLMAELERTQDEYNGALRDSLTRVLRDYNQAYGYTYILSKMGDNILLADERYDITEDVIKLLNQRYKPAKSLAKDKEKK